MTTTPARATGLRILLAHDLSASADEAARLITHAAWPASTVVRVVSSPVGVGPVLPSFAGYRQAQDHADELREAMLIAHERVATELRDAGLTVETGILRGAPERAIVADGRRFRADLIVVGARGQGSLAAALLGSVSRAVVEKALCSVLVARGGVVRRVLVASDGSPPAEFATSVVGTWPMFAEASILLVAVGEPAPRYPRAVLGEGEWRLAFREAMVASGDQACDVAEQALARIQAGDGEIDVEIRFGDVAGEITASARTWPADMVVVGAHSRPLLHRLFLGSVARTVVDGVDASVLVARPPAADRSAGD